VIVYGVEMVNIVFTKFPAEEDNFTFHFDWEINGAGSNISTNTANGR